MWISFDINRIFFSHLNEFITAINSICVDSFYLKVEFIQMSTEYKFSVRTFKHHRVITSNAYPVISTLRKIR